MRRPESSAGYAALLELLDEEPPEFVPLDAPADVAEPVAPDEEDVSPVELPDLAEPARESVR
ncbi:hypothetical protein BCL57_002955 [Agromyces flavus]|uniref:Uncharacterized protein n=1 Tax=Agromyces flavus TaxID=589382 RepID=A0ABT1KPH9_9MICO|nr:hypothetical protein [Agromyces flavus]MCP2368779.1 hypothetical protein [Agromyces flavus]